MQPSRGGLAQGWGRAPGSRWDRHQTPVGRDRAGHPGIPRPAEQASLKAWVPASVGTRFQFSCSALGVWLQGHVVILPHLPGVFRDGCATSHS